MFQDLRENNDRLAGCTLHLWDVSNVDTARNNSVCCDRCGGVVSYRGVLWYARGYVAAGGAQSDVLKGVIL